MVGMQDKLSAPPDFDGPVKDRKCTDILFTLAIIIMWISMTAVGISSVKEVQTERVFAFQTDGVFALCGNIYGLGSTQRAV